MKIEATPYDPNCHEQILACAEFEGVIDVEILLSYPARIMIYLERDAAASSIEALTAYLRGIPCFRSVVLHGH
jgi:hypothetical protein